MRAMVIRLSTLVIGGGLFVAAIGVVLVLSPLTSGGEGCGSPFLPSVSEETMNFLADPQAHQAACEDTTSARRGVALSLLLPGGGLAAAGVAVIGREPAKGTARV
jgi:hypothetical protein